MNNNSNLSESHEGELQPSPPSYANLQQCIEEGYKDKC
jgi:hypothetical protein